MTLLALEPHKHSTIDRYIPVCSEIERKAYAAAHRVLRVTTAGEKDLACPGARRTALVDKMAAAIAEEFGETLPRTR